ncbi:MAG: hypothetical protein ACU0BF_00940 [Paracoccaceae bacterium]
MRTPAALLICALAAGPAAAGELASARATALAGLGALAAERGFAPGLPAGDCAVTFARDRLDEMGIAMTVTVDMAAYDAAAAFRDARGLRVPPLGAGATVERVSATRAALADAGEVDAWFSLAAMIDGMDPLGCEGDLCRFERAHDGPLQVDRHDDLHTPAQFDALAGAVLTMARLCAEAAR